MLDFLTSLAAEAGERLLRAQGALAEGEIDFKGRRDMVTAVDREIERFLADRIAREHPRDAILAEESIRRDGDSGRVWIVDPLDGTTNFVHQHPMFCVSMALAEGYTGLPTADAWTDSPHASGFFAAGALPRLIAGVVHAPVLRETYCAQVGGGAFLNGRAVRVSPQKKLDRSLVATGFAYRRNELSNSNLENFRRLALEAQGIRRGGAAALDLAYVAAGRFEVFWELYLKPWDVAAGIVLVEEAGGRVTDFEGHATGLEGTEILATNGHLHDQVAGLLEGADPAWAAEERARLTRIGP